MRPRQLESLLQSACPILDFEGRPRVDLEQYSTSPHLASQIICYIEDHFSAISNQIVADFGCGCGILSIASGVMDADLVFSFDIDPKCIDITVRQCGNVDSFPHEIVQMDITQGLPTHLSFDTIIMNPPFGTRNSGIDMKFIDIGLQTAEQVFSLHKTSTRRYISKHCSEVGAQAELVATLQYDLPKTHKHHTKKSVDIEVDLWKVSKIQT